MFSNVFLDQVTAGTLLFCSYVSEGVPFFAPIYLTTSHFTPILSTLYHLTPLSFNTSIISHRF